MPTQFTLVPHPWDFQAIRGIGAAPSALIRELRGLRPSGRSILQIARRRRGGHGVREARAEEEKRRRIIRLGRVPSHPREANNLRAVLLPESSRPSAADHPWPPAMRNPVHGGASDAPGPPWRVQDDSRAAFHAPGAILSKKLLIL